MIAYLFLEVALDKGGANMSLHSDIRVGEGKNLEFKLKMPNSITLAKSIIAFSNTGGGKLIIGINDNAEIIGLENDTNIFELKDQVASIVYELCYPTILPDIYTTTINNSLLLIIEVFRGNLLPYYLKNKGNKEGVYIRVGATNRKASIENVLELERQRMNISFDQEPNRDVDMGRLDTSVIKSRFTQLGKNFDDLVMKNLKLIIEENGKLYPSNGLLILLGEYEHILMKCSRFKGNTMDHFLDRKEYSGDLFSQLEEVENFIKNHINLSSEIIGLQRTDQYEIPLEAIREGLVNAVVHRDYTNFGRDIKIGIYDDIVNIVSPGGFPSTITEEDILEGRSEIRNKVIARVFKELNYIEQWGSGVRRIISSCTERRLKRPEIIEKGDFVDVSLYRAFESVEKILFNEDVYTAQQRIIIDYLLDNHDRISTKIAAGFLGISDRATRSVLNVMVDKRMLVKYENGPQTHYRLPSSFRVTSE